jgi:Yip1 domain
MIKALLLVLDPAATWDAIVLAKRGWPRILLGYLLPMWLIAFVAEGYGLVHWGKPRGFVSQPQTFSNAEALIFELLQLGLIVIIVFVGAKLVKAVGETFHGRNNFTQAFTVVAYGLAPFFTVRTLDIFPGVSSWIYWVTWGGALFVTFSILYHGIPRVMLPDPPHAFGLYLVACVLLTMVTGLLRLMTFWYLQGKFGKLDALIAKIVAHLPFLQSLNQHHF